MSSLPVRSTRLFTKSVILESTFTVKKEAIIATPLKAKLLRYTVRKLWVYDVLVAVSSAAAMVEFIPGTLWIAAGVPTEMAWKSAGRLADGRPAPVTAGGTLAFRVEAIRLPKMETNMLAGSTLLGSSWTTRGGWKRQPYWR